VSLALEAVVVAHWVWRIVHHKHISRPLIIHSDIRNETIFVQQRIASQVRMDDSTIHEGHEKFEAL
jgi:hypothetical protein